MSGHTGAAALPIVRAETPEDRLAALFDAHHERLYRLARRMTRNADDGLDLVQETFLRAARAPRAIPRGASHEEAWLVRVLVNLQRDAWRRAAVRHRHAARLAEPGPIEPRQESALIARSVVWRALESLPPSRRAVIVLRELEQLPVPDVAALLGLSAITVRWHLAMGLRRLGQLIGDNGGERS